MKETSLSIKLEYPKINEVFKSWRSVSTWGKRRVVYANEAKKLKIIAFLNRIDCSERTLEFCISASRNEYIFIYNSTIRINIRDDVTQKIFEQKILNCIFDLIGNWEGVAISESTKYKELKDNYEKNLRELIFNYHNSKSFKEDRLKSVKDINANLIIFYTNSSGDLYEKNIELSKEKDVYYHSLRYIFWKDVYKHFISLIPYKDIREKYEKEIEAYQSYYKE